LCSLDFYHPQSVLQITGTILIDTKSVCAYLTNIINKYGHLKTTMIHYEHIPYNVQEYIEEVKQALYRDTNIIFAYLFGGLAKGVQKPLSDIDIAVYVRDANNIEYTMNLFLTLSDICHTSEIDIVILNTAPESFVGRIMHHKMLLVDKEPFFRHTFESLALRKYFDFAIKEKQILYRRYKIGRYAPDSSQIVGA
jgi:predicted nucleotidyltransferase